MPQTWCSGDEVQTSAEIGRDLVVDVTFTQNRGYHPESGYVPANHSFKGPNTQIGTADFGKVLPKDLYGLARSRALSIRCTFQLLEGVGSRTFEFAVKYVVDDECEQNGSLG